MNINDLFTEEKVRLDPKCWTGKKIGNPKTKMKGGVRVNNCVPAESIAENAGQPLSVQQLATISDAALDQAYGYGRSTPGNTFGWQANLKSAAYAKQMIDQGVTDIEAISDAIHKGWNTTAQAFVQDPEQFDDTAKLAAAGKLEAKLQQRAQLMKQNYAQLPEEEKEKDRVVARALLQAIRGEQGVAEGLSTDNLLAKSGFKEIRKMKHGAVYSNGHEAVSIRIDPSDPDVINWALGEVTGKRIEWIESGNDDKQEALHIIKTFTKQGVAEEQELDEKWSQKYKSSINCANPKGFSQKAHCAGRNKNEDVAEGEEPKTIWHGGLTISGPGSDAKAQQLDIEHELDEGGDVFMPNIKDTPEYKAGFATGKLPVPHPEGTQQYASYYKGVIDKASPTLSKVGEGEQQKGADYRDPREVDYDDEYDDMVARVKKLAGLGPLKTVYDPVKRVYRNMPTAVQPKK